MKKPIHKKPSLRSRLLFLTIFCTLVPMIASSLYMNNVVRQQLTERTDKDISVFLRQINENVDAQIKTIDDTIQLVQTNQTIRACLLDKGEDEYERFVAKMRAEKELVYCSTISYSSMTSDSTKPTTIKRLYVFNLDLNFYKLGLRYNYSEEEAYDLSHRQMVAALQKTGEDSFLKPPDVADKTIYIGSAIKDWENLSVMGHLVVDLDETVVADWYKNILVYEGAKWYLLDSGGVVLSAEDIRLLGRPAPIEIAGTVGNENLQKITLDGNEYFCAIKNTGKNGMTSIIMIPKKDIYSDLLGGMVSYFHILLLILLTGLGIGLYFSVRLTRPLKDITQRMELVGCGNFDTEMPDSKYSELSKLSTGFNSMAAKIDHLVNDVYQKQLLLKEAELHSLQTQINPHFLFNVLETVSWFAQAGRNDDVSKIIVALGEILRASITAVNQEKVTIQNELQSIDFYISIQKYRFEERLQYEIIIHDEHIKACYIPKLCLQPIVENAITHGLEDKIGVGRLRIEGTIENGDIVFEISDNGVGFDVSKLPPDSAYVTGDSHTHIGIRNSDKRIQLLYGKNYGLNIESVKDEGTKVTIRIPMDKEGNVDVQNSDS